MSLPARAGWHRPASVPMCPHMCLHPAVPAGPCPVLPAQQSCSHFPAAGTSPEAAEGELLPQGWLCPGVRCLWWNPTKNIILICCNMLGASKSKE